MKKNLLFFVATVFAFLMATAGAYSQSLELLSSEPNLQGNPGAEVKSHLELKNTTTSDLNFKIRATKKNLPEGCTYYFCDLLLCNAPTTGDFLESVADNTLAADATTGEACYLGVNIGDESTGQIVITYSAYVSADTDDKVEYDITFDIISSVKDEIQVPLTAGPNPAGNYIVFNNMDQLSMYNTAIYVYDMNGKLVASEQHSSGNQTLTVNTMNYQNGTYFYSVVSNLEIVKSGAFIVNK